MAMLTCHYNRNNVHLVLGEDNGALVLCDWRERCSVPVDSRHETSGLLEEAATQLDLYFQGKLREFTLPLAPEGTPFRRLVWRSLLEIPYGETMSYAGLAAAIGRRTAVRAVASAVASNRISVFIPCHRVIGSNGMLTGFRGGLDIKRAMLEMERKGKWERDMHV